MDIVIAPSVSITCLFYWLCSGKHWYPRRCLSIQGTVKPSSRHATYTVTVRWRLLLLLLLLLELGIVHLALFFLLLLLLTLRTVSPSTGGSSGRTPRLPIRSLSDLHGGLLQGLVLGLEVLQVLAVLGSVSGGKGILHSLDVVLA